MEFNLVHKKNEAQSLQERIKELEQQLAEAQATIHSLKVENVQNSSSKPPKPGGDISFASDEGFRQALLVAPYPLMIWREDGIVMMINDALTGISGYTREDIPTIEDWSHKAFADRFLEQPNLIFYEEFPGEDVKKSREFEITTRSGNKRIWDFSYAVLGTDEKGRWLMLTMAVDITERREIEEQLQENERKFAIIFDKAPFAAALSQLSDGRVTHINEEYERLLGYTRQEILGKTSLELGINPDASGRERILSQIQSRGSARDIEIQFRTKSGDVRNCLINLDQVSIEGQKYILQTAQDITERKRAEQALEESEDRFSKAFYKSPFGLNITRWRDGAILVANDTWLNLLGWTREEIIGKTTADFPFYAKPEDRQWVRERIMKGEVTGDIEVTLVRKDGAELVVTVASTIVELQGERCILGALTDITERRRTEEALRESEERYRAVIENAVDAIIVTDPSHGGSILSANRAACQMFGYSLDEFMGLDREAMIDFSDSRLEKFLRKRDLHGQGKAELTYIRRDGVRFPGELTSAYFKNQFGQQNAIAIIRDVTDRRKAEQALRESEQRYRGLFERMQEGLIAGEVITDENGKPIDYRYIDVNPATERQYGIPRERFIGRTYKEVLPEGDPAWIEILGGVALTGKPASIERYSQVSGRWFEAHAYSPRTGQFVNILTDITERKKVEVALHASEAKMRAVFRALTEGVVFLNQEGIVEEANDAVQLSFDHSMEELSDPELDPRTRIIRPDGTPFPVEEQPAMVALLTGRTVRDVELGVPMRDGMISWRLVNAQPVLDDRGNLLGAVASFFDITERKRAEQALRESEERFRSLADSMPQLVWTALPDGRVDYYNQRHQEYQDIKPIQEQDWEWAPTLYPDDSQATVDAWLHALETGEIYQIEHRVRMSDDSYRWHLSRGVPMRDDKGQVVRWFGTATDIHDLKLAEEQLKIYASRLEKSNRELEQFAFMASHDLQEPLRKIEMFGDLLLQRAAGLQENERNYLDRMRNAASRMRGMIEGLLQISRVTTQAKPFVQVNMSRLTRDVLSDLEDQIKDVGGKVEVGSLPVVKGDPLQLRQLMQNLIGNALKYRKPGKPPEIRIFTEKLPDQVRICVQDKGIGFPQEDADRIFEPFQRLVTRNQYEGSGIGLAICRRIVERHGGEIAAISEPGLGTTFIVSLPKSHTKKS
jgi:PAS domain S-box-containing protein